jgi:Family of unknown function (DUF5362)
VTRGDFLPRRICRAATATVSRQEAHAERNQIDAGVRNGYARRMSDVPEPVDSPYRAPEANLSEESAGVISDTAMRLLTSSRKWMRMMAAALMVNGAGTAAAVIFTLAGRSLPGSLTSIAAIVGLLFALLVFIPGLRLLQSSLWITRAERSGEGMDLVRALDRHQQFWKWMGLVVIAVIAFALLFILLMPRLRH